MTQAQYIKAKVEAIRKEKRKAIIRAKISDIGFSAVQRTLDKNKPPVTGRKTRTRTKAQYKQRYSKKSGLTLGK